MPLLKLSLATSLNLSNLLCPKALNSNQWPNFHNLYNVACAECGSGHFRNIDISLFLINYNIKENGYFSLLKHQRYSSILVRLSLSKSNTFGCCHFASNSAMLNLGYFHTNCVFCCTMFYYINSVSWTLGTLLLFLLI